MKWFLLLVTVAFVQYHGIKGLPLSDYDHTERQDENSDALLEEMENDDLFKSHTNVAKIVKRESDPGVFRFKPRFRSYAGSRLKNAGSRLKNFGNRLKNIGKKTSPNIGKTVSPNIGYTGLPSIGNTVSPKLSLLQKLEYLAPLSHVTRLGTDIFHFVHLVKEVEAREQEREMLKKEHDNKDKTEGVEAREQEKEMPKKEEFVKALEMVTLLQTLEKLMGNMPTEVKYNTNDENDKKTQTQIENNILPDASAPDESVLNETTIKHTKNDNKIQNLLNPHIKMDTILV